MKVDETIYKNYFYKKVLFLLFFGILSLMLLVSFGTFYIYFRYYMNALADSSLQNSAYVCSNLDSNPLQEHTGKRAINLTNNAALENKAAFCYAVTSGRCGQRQMLSTSPRREQALAVISPVAAVYKAQAGMAVKGAERPAACGGLPLTDGPACATPCGAAGDISSGAAPSPWIGKGRGDWVDRFPWGYVIPLMCGNLGI